MGRTMEVRETGNGVEDGRNQASESSACSRCTVFLVDGSRKMRRDDCRFDVIETVSVFGVRMFKENRRKPIVWNDCTVKHTREHCNVLYCPRVVLVSRRLYALPSSFLFGAAAVVLS